MPGQPTGPKVPLPAVGWRLPQKALPPLSSGSHLVPVPDFHAPSCPVGVVSSGLVLHPGQQPSWTAAVSSTPWEIFSASWCQENLRGLRRPFLGLQGTALLPSESIAIMGPGGWGGGSVVTFPVHRLVLCGASPDANWELCFPSQQRDRKWV